MITKKYAFHVLQFFFSIFTIKELFFDGYTYRDFIAVQSYGRRHGINAFLQHFAPFCTKIISTQVLRDTGNTILWYYTSSKIFFNKNRMFTYIYTSILPSSSPNSLWREFPPKVTGKKGCIRFKPQQKVIKYTTKLIPIIHSEKVLIRCNL